jgi:hypothetical protein
VLRPAVVNYFRGGSRLNGDIRRHFCACLTGQAPDYQEDKSRFTKARASSIVIVSLGGGADGRA